MLKQRMSFGEYLRIRHNLQHPERTALTHGSGFSAGVTVCRYPTREAMARAVRKEQQKPVEQWKLKPVVALADREGY